MTQEARHVRISGTVQGVWYRAWTMETATALGLVGWVRNRTNGDVELIAQGQAEALDHFLALLWDGPPAARVTNVTSQAAPLAAFERFSKRATL